MLTFKLRFRNINQEMSAEPYILKAQNTCLLCAFRYLCVLPRCFLVYTFERMLLLCKSAS